MSLYPNPARDEIELTTGKRQGEAILRITDVKGQVQYIKTYEPGSWEPQQKLDINDLAEGLYIVELIEESHKEIARFVKVQ